MQPHYQQQPPQRCYFNNNVNNAANNRNNNNMHPKFNRQQSLPNPPMGMQQQMNSSQNNPFIPLQAARKSTKGKDQQQSRAMHQPSKDVKMNEPKKQSNNTQSLPSTSQNDHQQKAKKESRADSHQDSRKSRLAIKF